MYTPWARYEKSNGGYWITRHYDDDKSEFIDHNGIVYRRAGCIVYTFGDFMSAAHAPKPADASWDEPQKERPRYR